jgi:hypothetical protein
MFKFYTLVSYYMISLYLVSYFKRKMNEQTDEKEFVEENFHNLFEFDLEERIKLKKNNTKKVEPGDDEEE